MSETSIVLTTIFEPNNVIERISNLAKSYNFLFVVAGDQKTPNSYDNINCEFLSIEKQLILFPEFAENLPLNHYVRKNIGYLYSMVKGAKRIVETDDDNFPLDKFLERNSSKLTCDYISGNEWINAYSFFTKNKKNLIWPRGFPLEKVKSNSETLVKKKKLVNVPIQQGLANNNPDVDAVYRMICKLPFNFDEMPDIALEKYCWCPFNSQVTTWFQDAFSLMYLPSTCTFRMTDIWRSFIAQRILWEDESNILFHSPSVYQERNEHNLYNDFVDEIPGYKLNQDIINCLKEIKLKQGKINFNENLLICYEALVEQDIFESKEIRLLELWIQSIENIKKLIY